MHVLQSPVGQFVHERRINTQVSVPYHARLRGEDSEGRSFKEDTRLDDLSVGGLHLRLTRSVPQGSRVSVTVYLSVIRNEGSPALRLGARGIVRRTEPQPD